MICTIRQRTAEYWLKTHFSRGQSNGTEEVADLKCEAGNQRQSQQDEPQRKPESQSQRERQSCHGYKKRCIYRSEARLRSINSDWIELPLSFNSRYCSSQFLREISLKGLRRPFFFAATYQKRRSKRSRPNRPTTAAKQRYRTNSLAVPSIPTHSVPSFFTSTKPT